jgi:glycosyltransferase involved in cell wall biosynthesis
VYGGLGTHVEALTAALAALGVRVDLFVPEREVYQAPPAGVTLRPVPVSRLEGSDGNAGFWISFSAEVITHIERLDIAFDVVHCHDWLTALAGAGLTARSGVPLLFSVHLPQTEHPHADLEMLGLRAATTGIVYSHAMRQELLDRDGVLPRLVVIPNGVDSTRFRPLPARDDDAEIVLFVGRLVAQKGVDVLLRSFAAALVRLPQARLVIAGDGDQALYLRRLARYLGVMSRVEFTGWQTGEELVRSYGRAAVVAMPSRYEPFGLVALEAMSCGRPVVAVRTGGLPEIIDDGRTGILVPAGDHLRFAQALVRLLADDRARAKAGLAAREEALRHQWGDVAIITAGQYQEALARPRPVLGTDPGTADLMAALSPQSRAIAEQVLGRSRK